jgi:hypothetical protein
MIKAYLLEHDEAFRQLDKERSEVSSRGLPVYYPQGILMTRRVGRTLKETSTSTDSARLPTQQAKRAKKTSFTR